MLVDEKTPKYPKGRQQLHIDYIQMRPDQWIVVSLLKPLKRLVKILVG
jgi:hypothetical protein